jgi:uncharacterized repeat protein (TIGR01451 family)
LPGKLTALAAGEFRAADGKLDVAVGVAGAGGTQLLIYDGAKGGLSGEPMQLPLPAEASVIRFGGMDGDPFQDLVIAAGSEIQIVHGWGRKQVLGLDSRVEHIFVGAQVRGLSLGHYIWDRDARVEIAALGDNGTLQFIQSQGLDTRRYSESEMLKRTRGNLQAPAAKGGKAVDVEAVSCWTQSGEVAWATSRTLPMNAVADGANSPALLTTTNLKSRETEEVTVLPDRSALKLVKQLDPITDAQLISSSQVTTVAGDMTQVGIESLTRPVAVIQLQPKLNGERDLVVLQQGSGETVIVPLVATTVTVDRFDDPAVTTAGVGAATCGAGAGDCSLRGAVLFANVAANSPTTINLPAGTYTLSINGATDAGCSQPANGDLGVNMSTNIVGLGGGAVIVQTGTGSGNNGDRVMCMNETFLINLSYSFSNITIVGGRDGTPGMPNVGTALGGAGIIGGELNNSLTLTNVTLANNQAVRVGSANAGGGGIQITGGNLNVVNCTIGGSSAPGAYTDRTSVTTANAQTSSGGGLMFTPSSPQHMGGTGILTVTGTNFTRNTSTGIGGGGADLLIFAFSAPGGIGSGSASISTSSFSNNQAANGGGIIVESLGTTVATTTLTNNSATNRGGGIYVGGASLVLNGTSPSITFSGNTAPSGGTSIATAAIVTVQGTNMTIGGSIEVGSMRTRTNAAGSVFNPTDVVIDGGTFNASSATVNISGNLSVGPVPGNVIPGHFNGDSATINLAGNLITDSASGTTFSGGTGTFNFNGSGAQSITGSLAPAFNNLTVNKPAGSTLTLGVNSTLTGNFTLTSGIFDLQGNTANRTAAGGTLTVANGTTLKIGGTGTLPSNFNTHAIGATSTIEYSGANQSVAALNSSQKYGNLTTSGSGTKTLAGPITVATKLLINAGTLDVSASNHAVTINGDFTNNVASANFNPRSGTVTFNGSAAQNINGSTASGHNFTNLTSNRTGTGDLILGGNTTVNGLLTLTSGNINTGANTLSMASGATRSRTSGYIIGREKRTYGLPGSFTFDVGTANGYSPVDTNVTAGSGDLTVLAVQGAQPSVVSARSLQRYWTITEGGAGVTANLVFNYLDPGDVMGNEANYQVLQVTGGARSYFINNCPGNCVSAAANTLALTGITNFSDFTAGEARADLQVTGNTDSPDPVVTGNNITYAINLINNGPDNSQTVTVTNPVPANTTFVSASFPAGWSRTDSVVAGGTGNIVFARGSAASAETAALQVVVKVNNNTGGMTITDTATAASAVTTDPVPGNETGTAMTLVHQPPAITSANNATFLVGSAGSFTVTTTGFPAPSIARGGVALPGGVTFVSNGDGTATLSGTPAALTGGTYAISFTAANVVSSTAAQSFTLTVNEAPYVTTQPTALARCVGQNASFTVASGGFPAPTIQW